MSSSPSSRPLSLCSPGWGRSFRRVPWVFRHRKVGLLAGKRTWGGLVRTADTPVFVDGGSPARRLLRAGRDPQLERAVEDAMRLLKEHPVDRMDHEPPPPTWGKRKTPIK